MPNPNVHDTPVLPSDFVKEPEILKFFMEDIDSLLELYEPGKPENKPDVTKELQVLKEKRENMMKEEMAKQAEYQDTMNKINMLSNPQVMQTKLNEQTYIIQQLSLENRQLQDKVKYLEDKMMKLINERIQERIQERMQNKTTNIPNITSEKRIELLPNPPPISHL
jgi:predicted nuclease with TOPRIM domain